MIDPIYIHIFYPRTVQSVAFLNEKSVATVQNINFTSDGATAAHNQQDLLAPISLMRSSGGFPLRKPSSPLLVSFSASQDMLRSWEAGSHLYYWFILPDFADPCPLYRNPTSPLIPPFPSIRVATVLGVFVPRQSGSCAARFTVDQVIQT